MEGEFHIADFSHLVEGLVESGLPRKGRFVQVRHRAGEEFLALAPEELCRFHAQVLEKFCQSRTPEWPLAVSPRGDSAEPDNKEFWVVGGGYWEMDDPAKTIQLYGTSTCFGPFEAYGLTEKINAIPCYQDYTIIC